MVTCLATREGLIGGKTSTGYLVDVHVPFVALPSVAALRQWVLLYNPANQRSCRALVMDVGPWNEHDHAYVFQPATLNRYGIPWHDRTLAAENLAVPVVRPQAESGKDTRGRTTNHAGIDLGERVWELLGMVDNSEIAWEFE